MTGRLVAQGALTIMDFSDAIISSTPPSNPFENMTWIDTSQNPPVHKIYKYFYDDDGNKIGEGWVELGETLPIPPGIAFGGYLTCKITFKAGSTGGIEISSGYFSNNKVPKTIISTNCRIVTQLTSNKGRIRFIIFTNKDTSLTYKQTFGTNNSFLIAVRQNGKWYYEGQGNKLVEFTPKSDYCNVGKIVEYSPSETGSGIKEIIMYAEDPESMFNLLTGEGERQGMFKTEDGKVFINGEYINAKNLKVVDTNNNTTLYINEQGEVTIRATDFSLEGKTIGDMLSEIEIGGRNFHLGSEKWSNSAFSAKTGSTIEGNVLTVQSKKTVDSCYMNVEPGEEYTFSVDMKTTTNTYNSHTYLIGYYNSSSNTRLSYEWNTSKLTTSWKRFSQTFTIPSNVTRVNIGYRSDSTTLISYRYPKFEKGNKATDWTPAPEDLRNEMDSAINLQKQRIDEIVNDNNLTASEKRQLQIMIEDIKKEYENIVSSCTKYSVDYTDLDVCYNDLIQYLEQNCAIYDLSITTGVDKDTLKGYFSSYYQTRETIYELLDTAKKTLLDNKLSSTDSEAVFKALTNNGKKQGLYMKDGNFYFNGQYINAKNLKVVDNNNNTTLYINQDGNVTIRATEFSLEGKTIDNYISEVNNTISNVSKNVTAQKERIDDILNDGNLSVAEKRQLQIVLSDLAQAHSTIGNNADTYEINHTQLDTLFTRLQTYLEQTCLINDLTVTTGVDKDTLNTYFNEYYTEREYIITEIDTAEKTLLDNKLSSTDSEAVFKTLTDNGKKQGLYLQNGNFYFNGQYINAKNLKVVDNNNNTTFYVDQNGNVTIRAKDFSLEGKTIDDYIDNIEIGGRNFLLSTATKKGIAGTNVSNQDTNLYLLNNKKKELNGQQLTLSFRYTVSNYTGGKFRIQSYSTTVHHWGYITPSGNGTFTYKSTITAPSNFGENSGVQIRMDGFNGNLVIDNMKLEKGDKATDWTPAPEDVENKMNSLVNAQKERIDEMLADGTLSVSEKRQLQRVLKDIEQEYTELSTIAQTYNIGINNFYAMYNTLRNYLTIDCKINDLTVSTGILKNTVQTCFENYYTERANIAGQVNSKIDSKIDEKLSASDSKAVFDTLTDNGKKQGLYLQDGNFYFNGQYINAKNLSVKNADGDTTLSIDSNGNVSILATAFKLGGKTITDIITENTVVTMKSVRVWYYISNSPTALSGGSWSTTKPTWVSGQYIWQKTVTTYSNDTTAESDPVCITGPQGIQGNKGDQGTSVTKVSNRYGSNTSKTTPPTTWYTSYPTWTKGVYIWTKSIISYSNGTTTETDPYVDTSWEGMSNIVDGKVDNSQTAVFNALTNNGQEQGIYLKDGKVYVNGTYIKANTVTGAMLQGDSIDGKTITGATLEGCRIFAAKDDNQTDGHKFRIYADGRIYSNNFIQCYGETPNDNTYSQLDDGFIIATDYVKSPAIKTTKQNLYFGINDVAVPGSGDNANRLRFCEISGNKFFMPDYNATSSTNGVRLGASGHMWSTVYAKGGVNTSSDRTVKENIRYLNAENELATQSEDVSEKDLYNFVRDDLMVAEYNFTGEERTEIGFIAQDILYNLDGSDNKVGQILVNKPDEEQSPLSYSEKTYSNILAGALRQAINKIESLEKRIEELEKK